MAFRFSALYPKSTDRTATLNSPPVGERSTLYSRTVLRRTAIQFSIPSRPTEHRWHRLHSKIDDTLRPTETSGRQSGARLYFDRSVPFCASFCPRPRDLHGPLGDGACRHFATMPTCLRARHRDLVAWLLQMARVLCCITSVHVWSPIY